MKLRGFLYRLITKKKREKLRQFRQERMRQIMELIPIIKGSDNDAHTIALPQLDTNSRSWSRGQSSETPKIFLKHLRAEEVDGGDGALMRAGHVHSVLDSPHSPNSESVGESEPSETLTEEAVEALEDLNRKVRNLV